MFNPHY